MTNDDLVKRFIARCEDAASWRGSMILKYDDPGHKRSAEAFRAVARWARSDPNAAKVLATELQAVHVAISRIDISDEQKKVFASSCFAQSESREQWSGRVRSCGLFTNE